MIKKNTHTLNINMATNARINIGFAKFQFVHSWLFLQGVPLINGHFYAWYHSLL
jgi:hypothetical protein